MLISKMGRPAGAGVRTGFLRTNPPARRYAVLMASRSEFRIAISFAIAAAALAGWVTNAFAQALRVEYYRLGAWFLPETKNAEGMATGNGFATENPWGAYTAYLLATNAKGQRTWRIENYLPQGATAQGSTMYLLEGAERALLVDTAQNTQAVMGKNDLKTVVRHLLGHDNEGGAKGNSVDFVVAITHSHGDHTGKNAEMSDRTIYFPGPRLPDSAPANYVPIKEGGGASTHGSGNGGRRDFAGRAFGEGDRHLLPYARFHGLSGCREQHDVHQRRHWVRVRMGALRDDFAIRRISAPSARCAAAHGQPGDPARPFLSARAGSARQAPMNGRPLDKQYVDDQLAAAEGVLNGQL